jgi:spore germination protein YaaH
MSRRFPARLALAVALVSAASAPAAAQRTEALWYLTGGESSTRDFVAHANAISIAAPQVFILDSTGAITGSVDARVVAAARQHHVKLVPLVMNPGFDQPSVHRVLTNEAARLRALRSLAALCRDNHFDGLQFDLENIHVSDRDAFSAFARASADSVHAAGCTLSAAVVPRTGDDPGAGAYDRWIYDNWRGAYDYKALASALDFISYMTYAQHTGGTTPGPVQGYPWTVACLEYVLSLGVPRSKISLGIAGYSDWWYPAYSDSLGAHGSGHDIGYDRVTTLLAEAHRTPVWDPVQKAAHAEWESHGVFQHLWIENARAFRAKLALVQRYRLRGYSVWVLGLEDPQVWAERSR